VNNIIDGDRSKNVLARTEWQHAGSIASVQSLCEATVLLIIVVAFAVVGFLCARRASSLLLAVDVASPPAVIGRALRLQMGCVTCFVFVTFVVRSMFSTMFALASHLRDYDKQCPRGTDFCDAACYNVFTHINQWIFYTPEFPSTIVLISSPLALIVALWSMTSRLTLQLMKPIMLSVDRPLLVVAVASKAQ
jgi:hypothetical protein